MAYVHVASPAFNTNDPELTNPRTWPSRTWEVWGCNFDIFRPQGQEAYMDYHRDYLPLIGRIQQFHPSHAAVLNEIPAFVDYSITPAPSWWVGGGLKYGWYYLTQISHSGTIIKVRGGSGWKDKVHTIVWDETIEEEMPNFGIVVYPDWWPSDKEPW